MKGFLASCLLLLLPCLPRCDAKELNVSLPRGGISIARQAYIYTQMPFSIEHWSYWRKQFETNTNIVMASNSSTKIRVRDMALLFLETMARESFLNATNHSYMVEEIVSISVNNEIYRYCITFCPDTEFNTVKASLVSFEKLLK